MSKPTLKACPFCGAVPSPSPFVDNDGPYKELVRHDGDTSGRTGQVTCGSCGVQSSFGYYGNGLTDEEVGKDITDLYNTRATEDNLHVQLQELLDYIDQFGTHTDDRRVTKARERAADFRERCAEGDPTSIVEAEQD